LKIPIVNTAEIPKNLLMLPPKDSDAAKLLLKENGFAPCPDGTPAKVIDSLYMGHRYRHEVLVGDLTLFMENQQAYEVGKEIQIQYRYEAIGVN